MECSFDGCNRYVENRTRMLCQSHNNQFLKGQPLRPVRYRNTAANTEWDNGYKNAGGYIICSRRLHGVYLNRAQHRIVMEEKLGRELLPGENVHHINGVRDDNRPENLELWVTSQPSGQRPADLVEWAYRILERYEK